MAKTILSQNQAKVLDAISQDQALCNQFYLTGGTALAEYYLHHRLSEDLDFFSETEVDQQAITVWFKTNQKDLRIKTIDQTQSFNRNLFFLHLSNKEIIKTEFTYFPFERIAKIKKINKLQIDSLLDIAVNKVFTIYQKPRARDFIDLYFILLQEKYRLTDLVKQAKIKFDWHVDYLQLGSQLLLAKTVKDYPSMIKKIRPKIWQDYFVNLAQSISGRVVK